MYNEARKPRQDLTDCVQEIRRRAQWRRAVLLGIAGLLLGALVGDLLRYDPAYTGAIAALIAGLVSCGYALHWFLSRAGGARGWRNAFDPRSRPCAVPRRRSCAVPRTRSLK